MANSQAQLVSLDQSQLVIIDMQIKLSTAMPSDAMQAVVNNNQRLIQAAQLLGQPILVTEQYPQGLGATMPELQACLTHYQPIEKTAFSACGEQRFVQKLHRDQSHIVLTGMEAHICVLQTALALQALGKTVFVVEDAVISRSTSNHQNAMARLNNAGCIITN
jgi:nicotinamidase-related amidase